MAGDEEELLYLMVAPDSMARVAACCTAAACRASPRAAAEERWVHGGGAVQPFSTVHFMNLPAAGIAIDAEGHGEMSLTLGLVYYIFVCR